MSPEDKQPKSSFEERIKSNVALWFLGALATGFSAGIGAVKWSDERYKVEPIAISERETLVKAQSDLVALRGAYQELEGQNTTLKQALSSQNGGQESGHEKVAGQLIADCASQRSELNSLKESYAKSQADLAAIRKSCNGAPAAPGIGIRPTEFSQISITVNYAKKRFADANLVSSRLGPDFKDLQLVVCTVGCNRTAQINYGYDLSAPVAFSVARSLTQAGITEFTQPMITQGDGPHKVTIYLAD